MGVRGRMSFNSPLKQIAADEVSEQLKGSGAPWQAWCASNSAPKMMSGLAAGYCGTFHNEYVWAAGAVFSVLVGRLRGGRVRCLLKRAGCN